MPQPIKRWPPRFGLWTVMLITAVCAVTAAAGSYFFKAVTANQSVTSTNSYSAKGIFIMFALVAPMAMLIVVSALYQISRISKSKRKKKRRFTQN